MSSRRRRPANMRRASSKETGAQQWEGRQEEESERWATRESAGVTTESDVEGDASRIRRKRSTYDDTSGRRSITRRASEASDSLPNCTSAEVELSSSSSSERCATEGTAALRQLRKSMRTACIARTHRSQPRRLPRLPPGAGTRALWSAFGGRPVATKIVSSTALHSLFSASASASMLLKRTTAR
jgi:hypothetical protein